jgi:superfamily II RNA helicase
MIDDSLNDFLVESIPIWANEPVTFFREVLNFEPDPWQIEAINAIRDNRRVAIKSGQGVGKTGVEGGITLWFLTCHYNARVVATAPTKQQLHDVL